MAYSELIKDISRIRDYMREFFVYGFKSREEIGINSPRSYDNERRRIESWLSEYMSFRQEVDGKRVFISVDSRRVVKNPFYQVWKTASFTKNDISLHFWLMDILSQDCPKSLTDITEEMDSEYLPFFEDALPPDESTLRKKLREYTRLGIVTAEKHGKQHEYRRVLSQLRAEIRIIENNLRERDYSFDYSKQPSKAMMKYRRAFLRNDEIRYKDFLSRVEKGEAVMHTGTLYPYDVIRPVLSEMSADERRSVNAAWNSLEDFTDGENALAVIDGSGSMYYTGAPKPAEVALSLGVYFAEHSRGMFAGHFITFSSKPRLVEIKGRDIFEKIRYCMSFNEAANTNIKAVFDLILMTAVKNRLPQNQRPKTLYIISDMEFDCCAENADITNFEYAKRAFSSHGYKLPQVVFWNVQSRNMQQPVTMNEQGVTLVSGASPRVFSMIKAGMSPMSLMLETLSNEIYAEIKA